MRFLSDFLQFSKPIQQSNRYHSAIYILNPENTYALQLEIDWMEYETFMYLVYLKNGNLPNKGIIYSYPDGHWCRKFLEEIYKTKCFYKNSTRYTDERLFEHFMFYKDLIMRDPHKLQLYFESL